MEPCKHDWYFYETIKALKCTRCGKTTTPVIRAATNEPEVLYAFPNPHRTDELGMPLRDYFASDAMKGLLSNPSWRQDMDFEDTAHAAYLMANAMMKAREA